MSNAEVFAQPVSIETQDTGARQEAWYSRSGKRAKDILIVLLAAPVVVPVVLIFALAIFLSDRGNPFYYQERVGMGGRRFRIWKLRSMVVDADAYLETYLAENPEARAEWDLYQKLQKDPRIIRVGAVVRATSLDELPQLWNVLVGDMSLVGPRPMMSNQVDLYPCDAYYKVRPGLTGFWQVSSRNKSTFAERARFDRLYTRRVSLLTDIGVMLRTVKVVLRGTGV